MAPHKYNTEEIIAAFKNPTWENPSKEPEDPKHLDINEIKRALTYLDPNDREVWISTQGV